MIKNTFKAVLNHFGLEIRRFSDSHSTPISSQWLGNFFYFVKRYEQISSLSGDVIECGVGRGRTFLYLAFLVSEDSRKRTLWGFDSFAGFPKPTEQDKSFRNPQEGERNNTTIEYVTWLLRDAGVSKDVIKTQIKMIPGFFNESLHYYNGEQIAFLHLDGDLYQSYKDSLEILYPRVAKGGLVLFDEYDDPAFPGARQAIDEYFSRLPAKPSVIKDRLSGKNYIFKP